MLESGAVIYLYHGMKSNKLKKNKALELAIKLNNENNAGIHEISLKIHYTGKGKIITIGNSSPEAPGFWKVVKATGANDVPDEIPVKF